MPTASKLTGAILFGAMGLALAVLFVPALQGADAARPWHAICGVIGLWAGWSVIGARTGQGYGQAVGIGLTAAAALAVVTLFVMSFWTMISRAMRGAYDDPVEAVVRIFEFIAEYAVQLASVEIAAVLVIGGVIAGLTCEFIGRRYR
ncbi:TrgA family protein [Salipiger sp. IMCC34102]|uniref:TrgA family protein n=1 Tax=Salipiger sp. IMCC34102 TaxID=2510647 RepID=UPI00101CE783|nr:TrgA family protein [Salipiger sp. IMCC34102]RYH03289.1 TrgA family protein [Salipiger sp. IMCC34102]